MLHFVGDGDQKKFTKNRRHFSMQNFPGKFEEKIHKMFLESGQSTFVPQQGSNFEQLRTKADQLTRFCGFLVCTLLHTIPSGVAPANQTKGRSVHELFAGAFRNKSSM